MATGGPAGARVSRAGDAVQDPGPAELALGDPVRLRPAGCEQPGAATRATRAAPPAPSASAPPRRLRPSRPARRPGRDACRHRPGRPRSRPPPSPSPGPAPGGGPGRVAPQPPGRRDSASPRFARRAVQERRGRCFRRPLTDPASSPACWRLPPGAVRPGSTARLASGTLRATARPPRPARRALRGRPVRPPGRGLALGARVRPPAPGPSAGGKPRGLPCGPLAARRRTASRPAAHSARSPRPARASTRNVGLVGILGGMNVAQDAAVDPPDQGAVPLDEIGEGGLVPVAGEAGQLGVRRSRPSGGGCGRAGARGWSRWCGSSPVPQGSPPECCPQPPRPHGDFPVGGWPGTARPGRSPWFTPCSTSRPASPVHFGGLTSHSLIAPPCRPASCRPG